MPVPLTEGVSGDEPQAERDAASCGLARNHDPREASENTRPPATTRGTCECTNAKSTGTAHVQRPETSPRRTRGQQIAAVERREASVPRRADTVKANLRGDARRDASRLRAYVTGPPKGAAAPERLSALRSLALREGDTGKARRS